MDQDKKRTIMVGTVVLCLSLAGFIIYRTYSQSPGGIDAIPAGEMLWVKCNNPDCAAEYEMGKKDYFKYVEEHLNPMAQSAPALVCKKCGKESVYRAVKCGNPDCGTVFFYGLGRNDFADRCPKCGYSQTERDRKERAARQGK